MTAESIKEREAEKVRGAQASVASGSDNPEGVQPIAQPQSDSAMTDTSDDSTAQLFSRFHEDNVLSQSIQQLVSQLFQQIQLDTNSAIDQVKKEYQVEQQKLTEALKDAQLAGRDWQTMESDYLAQIDTLKRHKEVSEKESQRQEEQLDALNSQVQECQNKIRSQDDELRQLKQLLVMREGELSSSADANTRLIQELSNLRSDYEQLKGQIAIVAQVIQNQGEEAEPRPLEPAALLAALTVEIQTLRSEMITKNELLAKFGRGFYEQINKSEE